MAHLIFDEDEARQLRESARERAAAGEGLLAYTLEQLAAEGIYLSKATPYADVQGPPRARRHGRRPYSRRRLTTPKHGPWRAHVVLHDVAERQIDEMIDEDREVLDAAIVRLSLDHRIGSRA
ncbi:hypothetical protein OG468_41400 (plasmid) [Streptomyces zaomyceticus]|uniref:Transposase n=1 Tax=Streptomyces zaomyceticus TaxID=68286 RepID=A0ABZ1LQR6_9ACTN